VCRIGRQAPCPSFIDALDRHDRSTSPFGVFPHALLERRVTIIGYDARSGTWRPMPDREKVLTVLRKRFPEASVEQIAAAANAIVGLGTEWREIVAFEEELLPHLPEQCPDPHGLVARLRDGGQFKLLERVPDEPAS
jgi:hypothetical protein